jgi:hypothetical protein
MSHCDLDRPAATIWVNSAKEVSVHKLTLIGILMLVAATLAVSASATTAKDGRGVVRNGSCSAASDWKLEAKSDERLETEFEVDQDRIGKRWTVTLTRNGATVFRGVRTTVAPSGSFTVRRLLAGPASGRIVATARALDGGETCRAQLSL